MKRRRTFGNRTFDCLETRLCLSSVGWDGPGLGSAELTYFIGGAPSSLNQAEVEATLQQALEVWSDVVDVQFTQTSMRGQRDSIDFQFAPIDGAGGTLAQAYLPDDVNSARIAGDITFDTSETWEIGNRLGSRAFDLLWVAVHEIGHALGLDHSRAGGSVMNDTVSPNQSFARLSAADIDAALALYAAADTEPPLVNLDPDVGPSTEGKSPELPTTPDKPADELPDPPPRDPWIHRFDRPSHFHQPRGFPWSGFGRPTDDVFATFNWESFAWRPFGRLGSFGGFSAPLTPNFVWG